MKKICFFIGILMVGATHAQSYHFSQFYSTPVLVNPAFTGFIEGDYRLAGNYRSQWAQGGNAITTSTMSADLSLLRSRLAEGNKLGVGVVAVNDRSMSGAMLTNTFALSTAYNIALDAEHENTVGLGFQGVYNQRRIDFSKLTFENQLGQNGFDNSLPIGESIPSGRTGYFDVNAGAAFNRRLSDRSLFVSAGVFNILKQKDNYLLENFGMPIRYSVMGGGDIDVGEAGIASASFNYQSQGNTNEFTIGGAYSIQLNSEYRQMVNFGAWYRYKDAIIPYVGYINNGFQAGFSYDYTVSELKTGAQVRNGFEISLLYSAPDKSEQRRLVPWY